METATPIYNQTTNPSTEYALPYYQWVLYETFSIILISLSLYICIVLVRFSFMNEIRAWNDRYKIRKASNAGNRAATDYNSSSVGGTPNKPSSNSSNEGGRKRKADGTGKSARPLRVLCLFAAFLGLARISSDQLELATYGHERIDCKLYQVIVVVTYASSATAIYSALWVRLRIFFNHPIMKHLGSWIIRVLIWFAIGAVVGSALLNTLIFTLATSSIDSPLGCILGPTTSISPTVRYVILIITTVGSQLLLLFLFLYPLIKHSKQMKRSMQKNAITATAPLSPMPKRVTALAQQEGNSRSRTASKGDSDSDAGSAVSQRSKTKAFMSFRKSRKQSKEKRLFVIMRRVTITATICILSDVITGVATIGLNNHPRVASNLIYNFNLLINITSVVFGFGDWRERLFPLCSQLSTKRERTKREEGSPVTYKTKANGDHLASPPNRNSPTRAPRGSCDSPGIVPSPLSSANNCVVHKNGDDIVFTFNESAN